MVRGAWCSQRCCTRVSVSLVDYVLCGIEWSVMFQYFLRISLLTALVFSLARVLTRSEAERRLQSYMVGGSSPPAGRAAAGAGAGAGAGGDAETGGDGGDLAAAAAAEAAEAQRRFAQPVWRQFVLLSHRGLVSGGLWGDWAGGGEVGLGWSWEGRSGDGCGGGRGGVGMWAAVAVPVV